MRGMEAPKTFRTPISFVRCSATNVVRPNNPKQAINNARIVNVFINIYAHFTKDVLHEIHA